MSPQFHVQRLEEVAARKAPVRPHPFFHPLHRALQFLPRGAPFDARRPLPVFFPEEFEAEEGEPTSQGGMVTAESKCAGFIGSHLQVEFLQPLRKLPVELFRFFPKLEGADPIVGVATDCRLALAAGFDHLLVNPGT